MKNISSKELNALGHFAINLAKEGGKVLLQYWGKVKGTDKQIAGDLITEADKETEQHIVSILQKEYPSHAILAEESGSTKDLDSDFLWIIDPLDGTTNYAHQYPVFSISIALLFQGQLIVGVVYNPIQDELFHAIKEEGAFLNGSPLYVSKVEKISQSLLASGFPYDRLHNPDNNYAEFCRLTDLSQGVRRAGSAAIDLAYVAAGRFDGYWEKGIKSWDIAAGILLVLEAGGKVSAYDGSPYDIYAGRIMASNGIIHQEFSHVLTSP